MAWFSYDGGEATDSANYSTGGNPSLCPGNDVLCAINADDDGNGHPILTAELKDEMLNALAQGQADTNVLLSGVRS